MDSEDSSEGELEDDEDWTLPTSNLFVLLLRVPPMEQFLQREPLLLLPMLVGDPQLVEVELPVPPPLGNQDHLDLLLPPFRAGLFKSRNCLFRLSFFAITRTKGLLRKEDRS